MASPDPVKKVETILEELNAEKKGLWVLMADYYGITTVKPTGATVDFTLAEKGLVLVAFLNTNTAEVRFHIAKFLDTPERDNLFPND